MTGVVHVLLVQVKERFVHLFEKENTFDCDTSYHILPQARGVLAMDGGTSSDPYCKVAITIL